MGTWMHVLREETQALVPVLEGKHCQVVWRSEEMVGTSEEPFEIGSCWLEVWMGGNLICFDGPFECPISGVMLEAAGGTVIEQAALLVEYKKY
ncbi:hypothetical protein Q0M94_02260 [Deinococcus radiomollis]|uniref:hypothetical protein n=1 Tax=Deinococcus radiomollis TaxID=468916 RepID=UPI003891BD1B